MNNNLPKITQESIRSYAEADPFPHMIFDNVIEESILMEAVSSIKKVPNILWSQQDHSEQVFKRWIQNPAFLPYPARSVLEWMNSPEFMSYISELTGIKNLIQDDNYNGGGVHRVSTGGKLGIHYDFNYLPGTNYKRRINALLYLNDGWEDEWGGFLELWDSERCVKKISPIFNRMIIFNTNKTSYHGHPDPVRSPDGVDRLSFAMYGYSEERPEDREDFHWSIWPDQFRDR